MIPLWVTWRTATGHQEPLQVSAGGVMGSVISGCILESSSSAVP